MTMTLDRPAIDAARQRAQDDLRPYLTHSTGWGVPAKLTVIEYAEAMGWRLLRCFYERSTVALFVKESSFAETPRYRLAEYVDGDVTFFGFPTEHDRERGIEMLAGWHEMVSSC